MELRVCFACLTTIESLANNTEEEKKCGPSLLTRFLKFVQYYLQISPSTVAHTVENGDQFFCEKCEVTAIQPICKIYLELISAQLRLSCELGQLGKLLENSQRSIIDKISLFHMQTLTNQLGMENVIDVEAFRTLLTQKCKLIQNFFSKSILCFFYLDFK